MVLQLIWIFGCPGVLLDWFQDFSVCDCPPVYRKLHECITRKLSMRWSVGLQTATTAVRRVLRTSS
jgi:hypothetical protein